MPPWCGKIPASSRKEAVRRIKEGTSAVLLQSGFEEKWWADSMECFCYLRNVQDLLADGKALYQRRFGEPFNGPVIPFGTMVEYLPNSSGDPSRLHQFGKKVLPGIFLQYALIVGRIWKGDTLVAYIEESENLDTSEIHPRRLNAKEVLTPQWVNTFYIFPVADGTAKLFRRDHEFREPTRRRAPTSKNPE